MILTSGSQAPSRLHIDEVRARGDSTFCYCASSEFMQDFPRAGGWVHDQSAVLLAMRDVEEHTDPWTGMDDEPLGRAAIFWLLEGGGSPAFPEGIVFCCGGRYLKMRPGDFVVFDDSVEHMVFSESLWRGAAVQLK